MTSMTASFATVNKAFDKVRHDDMFGELRKLDMHGKDLQLLQNLYWNQSACIRVDGECSNYTDIARGARQGCVMSPDLFNYYTEKILREINNEKGLRVGGSNITNIRYADDKVLLAESASDLQKVLDVVIKESEKKADLKKRLEGCEMWFLRKMMRIPWTDKVSNEEVLARAGVSRRLIKDIRIRQMRFLGHVPRKEGLENLALTGKIEGKRSRGRQRILWMNSLAGWIQTNGITIKETNLIHMTRNRELWQSMIAKVS
eukprot:gene10718-biopygen13199